ncbi:hypothetical protein SASK122_04590 [Staphylococcus argenteus]|nr:Uncharacterised protein [Staphylococcus argenteus]
MPLGFFEVVYNDHDNLANIGMCMLKMYSKTQNTKIYAKNSIALF